MASTSKAFKIVCGSASSLLTPDDTHNLCVFCLGKEHARDVLEGKICVHYEKHRSRLSLFSRKEGQPSASRDSGPTAAEARRRLKSRGSQLDMADELERGTAPFRARRPRTRVSCWNCDFAIFLTSLDSAASALLGYAQEEQEMFEGEEVETEPSQFSCTAYERVIGDYGSEKLIFLAINPQLERSLPFFKISMWRLRRSRKSDFFLVFIGFSILVMLTLRGC